MSLKLNTKLILTSLKRSLIFPFSYEVLVLAYYLLGMHDFIELHILAWTPTVITTIIALYILGFLWGMRNRNYRKYH